MEDEHQVSKSVSRMRRRLRAGEPAPGLSGLTHDGRRVSLESYRGRRVLVCFFRFASCPLCRLRVDELWEAYPRLLARGIEVVVVFQSSPVVVASYVGQQPVPFPMIGDPGMMSYREWGVEESWWGVAKALVLAPFGVIKALSRGYWPGQLDGPIHRLPADFIVGPEGVLEVVHYAGHPGDHLTLHGHV